ncbi:MAG: HEAT repeat domain-containing protein [Gemmatimonadota bacterium]|nr:HEAT repeat domain-containing protein [Gemmatimonadota bacterium]
MTRFVFLPVVAGSALLCGVTASVRAQSLGERITATGSGSAEMSFASRAGTCGDGRTIVGFGRSLFIWPNTSINGNWHGPRCEPGPLHVVFTLDRGVVTAVRAFAGSAPAVQTGVRQLGAVPALQASEYLLDLAVKLEGTAAGQALLAGALADSVTPWQRLIRIARDDARSRQLRGRALSLAGVTGGDAVVGELDAIARDSSQAEFLREGALATLASETGGSGVPTILRMAERGSEGRIQKKAIFWLGQTHDPRARQLLERIITAPGWADELRGEAIFSLGQDDSDGESLPFLRKAYATLPTPKLKERVLQAVAQSSTEQATDWLLAVAQNDAEPIYDRKQAVFWAGQQSEVPFARLAGLYAKTQDRELKKQLIFVYSQRDGRDATDKLIEIARSEPDRDLKKQAIFWLGQRHDDRAVEFIRDILKQ